MATSSGGAYQQGWVPIRRIACLENSPGNRALSVRTYLLRFAGKGPGSYTRSHQNPPPKMPDALGLRILAPAYVLSELKGFLPDWSRAVSPFLIIDLVVASLTLRWMVNCHRD